MKSSRPPKEKVRRSYQQYCGLARTLDVIGGRWTLLLVRHLLIGPARYGQLLENHPGLTTNLLAQRLHELTEHGVVEACEVDGRGAYRLTARGRALEPAVHALGAWGQPLLQSGPHAGDAMNLRWAMLALKRRHRGAGRGSVALDVALDESEQTFQVVFAGPRVDIEETREGAPEARLAGPPTAMGPLLYGRASVRGLVAKGALARMGSERALQRFCEAFELSW